MGLISRDSSRTYRSKNVQLKVTKTSEFFWNTFTRKRTLELELKCLPIKLKPDDKRTEKLDKDELNDKNLRPRKLWPPLWARSNFVEVVNSMIVKILSRNFALKRGDWLCFT